MKRLLVFLVAMAMFQTLAMAQSMETVVIGNYANELLDSEAFRAEIYERQRANPNALFQVEHAFEESYATYKSTFKDDHLFANKNIYILIGVGNEEQDKKIVREDWNAIYTIMNYLSRQQMRVIINVAATAEHLKLASESDSTAVIIWSSHGNEEGIYDYNKELVPYDVFKNKSKSMYQLVVSTCYGSIALEKYNTEGLYIRSWSGLTNSRELEKYLLSDDWNPLNGKALTRTIGGLTCTRDGNDYRAMVSSNNRIMKSVKFSSLENCARAIVKSAESSKK